MGVSAPSLHIVSTDSMINGGHTILYLTNERSAKCEILYDNTSMINVVIQSL